MATSKTVVFESPMKLDKLVYSKKDRLWRAKIVTMNVERMYDSIKTTISLNLTPFEESIARIKNEIESAKAQPDLFDNKELKNLMVELKEEETNMHEQRKKFGQIEFTSYVESLTQKDNQTAMTILVPKETIPMFMEKITHEADNTSKIEFYI